MRMQGILDAWNDDRGFGFITPSAGGTAVFVHVSAFAPDGLRPRIGEPLWYQSAIGPDGRRRAVRVTRGGGVASSAADPRRAAPPTRRRTPRRASVFAPIPLLALLLLAALVGYGFVRLATRYPPGSPPAAPVRVEPPSREPVPAPAQETRSPRSPVPAAPARDEPARVPATWLSPKPSYTCDGRRYCSQMHSCDEATWFLQNCPGTHMDGDHDGVACERQWCG